MIWLKWRMAKSNIINLMFHRLNGAHRIRIELFDEKPKKHTIPFKNPTYTEK